MSSLYQSSSTGLYHAKSSASWHKFTDWSDLLFQNETTDDSVTQDMKLPSHTKTKQPSGSRAPFYWQGQFCKWPALLSKDHDRFTDSWLSIPRVLRQQQIEGCTNDHNKVCVHVMYKSRKKSKHVRRCDDSNKSRPFKPSVEYIYSLYTHIYSFIILKTFTLPEHDDDQGCASGHPPKRLPPGIVIILVVCCFFLHLKDAPGRRSRSLDGSIGKQFTKRNA